MVIYRNEGTVKSELMNTSEQPANSDPHFKSQFKSLEHKPTSEQRPLVNNGHKFGVPRVAVEHRFDCISDFQMSRLRRIPTKT